MSVKSFKELKRVFSKNPNLYKEDGVDHVRISPYGKHELGRWLSPEFSRKVSIPHLGEFASVRNFWVWLTTDGHPDQIRAVNPKDLERWVKGSKVKKGNSLHLFSAVIGFAKYQQLIQHKPKLEDVPVPVLVYQESKEGFRTSMPYEQWYVTAAKTALEAYLKNEKPVFFVDDQPVDVESYLRDEIMQDLFAIDEDEERPVIQPKMPAPRPRKEKTAAPTSESASDEQPPESFQTEGEHAPELEHQPPASFVVSEHHVPALAA